MRRDEYWKNFNLGTEIDIAGRFLFNGLRAFHEMEHFAAEEDAFEFLYATAVGMERLLKIAVILTEHDKAADQTAFEKGLITHSHQELVRQLRKNHKIYLSPAHNDFVSILSRFYKSHRYGRFSLASAATPTRERDELNAFFEKYLKIKIETEGMFNATPNERRYRKYIGSIISNIVLQVYDIVKSEARRLNLYTYEVDNQSKGAKIFIHRSFDFEEEDILQVELIAYFVSERATGSNAKFIRDHVKPLPFDPALESDYLAALRSDRRKLNVIGELEVLYGEVKDFKCRRSMLEAATSDHLSYGDDDQDDEENDENDLPESL